MKALAQRLEHQHKLVAAHAERSVLARENETLVERVRSVEGARLPSNQEIHALLEVSSLHCTVRWVSCSRLSGCTCRPTWSSFARASSH